jgi:hypothetical protein
LATQFDISDQVLRVLNHTEKAGKKKQQADLDAKEKKKMQLIQIRN